MNISATQKTSNLILKYGLTASISPLFVAVNVLDMEGTHFCNRVINAGYSPSILVLPNLVTTAIFISISFLPTKNPFPLMMVVDQLSER